MCKCSDFDLNYLNLDQITCMFYPPTPTGLQGNEAAVV